MNSCFRTFFWRTFLLSAVVYATCLTVLSVSAAPPTGYYLVWGDEFNGSSLDPGKWWVWNGLDRSGYTVPDAVTIGGGYLTIHTYTTNGSHYSAIISSDARFRARYGYTEASVEFNGAPGMFSDFWLQSPDNTGAILGNPAASGAEIDVCEHRVTDVNNADDISGMVTIDVHWDGYTPGIQKTATSGLVGSGLGTGFHTYALLWNSTNYSVSFDGVQTWSTNAGISQRTEIVMFSSEVDSNSFCGIVPTNGYGNFLVSTTSTVVDFVRFYAPTSTVYWIGASSANWSDSGNWLSNMIPASASDAVFSYLSVGNFSITLGQNIAVNSLSIEESGPIGIFGNTLTINSGGIDMLSAVNDAGIYSALVLGAAQAWNIAAGRTLVVDTMISGPGNLTLNGPGNVVIEGTNNSSGATTISNGTLTVTGVMTNAVIANGGKLSGTGTLMGPVLINAGGTVSPGPGIAELTINNTLTLQTGSSTVLDINKTAGTCDAIVGLTKVNYGGTLGLNNQAGTLTATDAFKLFDADSYSGGFSAISPSAPGYGLGWDTNTLAIDGTIRVKNVAIVQTTNILESRFGNSTSGSNDPVFAFTGFSSTISATKSTAKGCSSPGSSRFSTSASPSTSFSVTPTLIPGTTYSVAVTWGYNGGTAFQESSNLVVKPTATGVSSTTFPSTTTAFSSGSGDTKNNAWETVGSMTPNTPSPTVTFTYVSGLSAGRFYADAVRFVSQLPNPGTISLTQAGGNAVLNWLGNFTLQSGTNVLGPFTDVPGPVVVGPYTNGASGSQKFFRLRQ